MYFLRVIHSHFEFVKIWYSLDCREEGLCVFLVLCEDGDDLLRDGLRETQGSAEKREKREIQNRARKQIGVQPYSTLR